MLTPARTGQAGADLDRKCETDYPRIEFSWFSRVRKIWVACWKCSIGALSRSSRSPTKNKMSMRGRNRAVL